jgi:subtilisin family serine protease
MRAFTPLALCLSLVALPVAADDNDQPVAAPPPVQFKAPKAVPPLPEKKPVKISKSLKKKISSYGFEFEDTGEFVHKKTGTRITKKLLQKAGLQLDEEGRLVYSRDNKIEVEERHLENILLGLLDFGKVAAHDPKTVGKSLQAWGIPPAYDGVHLLNPDGSATYFGLMLFEGLRENPARIKNLSGERLSKALELFKVGHDSAFYNNLGDAAKADIRRAWGLLNWDKMRSGETRLNFKPYADLGDQLGAYRDLIAGETHAVSAGGAKPKGYDAKASAEAIAALNKLQRVQYHSGLDLAERKVPPPKTGVGKESLEPLPMVKPIGIGENAPPEHGALPKILALVERVRGEPMTAPQMEAFVKSFPLGEIAWRSGAPEAWRMGFTGKKTKVAVIDTGVAHHPHLGDAVKERKNFTRQRGPDAYGRHGTHVAGTIHAIAPDAEIRSYTVLEENRGRQRADGNEIDKAILSAIDEAVGDGNKVINMSLGAYLNPSNAFAEKIQRYSQKGVIFVVSAGNSGPDARLNAPASAPDSWAVGALDAQGRITTFTTAGETWDPAKMTYAIKDVFMAPGKNVNATVKGFGLGSKNEFGTMSGTSMAAPYMTGAVALSVEAVRGFKLFPNPVSASRKIYDAFKTTAREMSLDELPSGIPPEKRFFIIRPAEAIKSLRGSG